MYTRTNTMNVFDNIIRPLLFKLPPEQAHKLAEFVFKIKPMWKAISPLLDVKDHRLETNMGGLHLPNPIGLAAGYDKDCKFMDSLRHIGFGYLVGGTVVTNKQPGNAKPRLLRDKINRSLVNALGFPSKGLETAYNNLKNSTNRVGPTIVSISGLSIDQFEHCYNRIQKVCDGVELNISSPNTDGIRIFQEIINLEGLLTQLNIVKNVPIFVKLPPYLNNDQKGSIMDIVDTCIKYSVEGVTVANTIPTKDTRLFVGKGGISGRPLYLNMLRMVKEIRSYSKKALAINACGGIFSGDDVIEALNAGATTVQLYTSFVYQGPGIVRSINNYLIKFMNLNLETIVRNY